MKNREEEARIAWIKYAEMVMVPWTPTKESLRIKAHSPFAKDNFMAGFSAGWVSRRGKD